jgi:hypothetical protein
VPSCLTASTVFLNPFIVTDSYEHLSEMQQIKLKFNFLEIIAYIFITLNTTYLISVYNLCETSLYIHVTIKIIPLFSLAQQPKLGICRLVFEIYRPHTHSERVIVAEAAT